MTDEELAAEREYWIANLAPGKVLDVLVADAALIERLQSSPTPKTLAGLRGVTGKGQVAFAALLGTPQPELSRIERRSYTTMLQRYAVALGGRCRVLFDVPGHGTFELVDPAQDPK